MKTFILHIYYFYAYNFYIFSCNLSNIQLIILTKYAKNVDLLTVTDFTVHHSCHFHSVTRLYLNVTLFCSLLSLSAWQTQLYE
jgi:hypothetical protein